MRRVEVVRRVACVVRACSNGVAVLRALRISIAVLGTSFQQYATLLRSIRWRRSQASSHRSQTPFLDVCLDENEAGLTKVDVNSSRTICTDRREEVLRLEPVNNLLELFTIASEEDSTGSRTITYPNDITLHQWRTIGSRAEWLIVAAGTSRLISDRVLVITWQ
jgi:hypothetical protein